MAVQNMQRARSKEVAAQQHDVVIPVSKTTSENQKKVKSEMVFGIEGVK
jgi:hypothetical protein